MKSALLLVLGIGYVAASPVCFYEKTAQHNLYGHVAVVIKSVSLEGCRSNCTLSPEVCLSFNYNYATDSCFMNDQTKTNAPADFGPHKQSDYFERVCHQEHTEPPFPYCSGHQCSDGICLHRYYVCNGRPECEDGSDEEGCPTTPAYEAVTEY